MKLPFEVINGPAFIVPDFSTIELDRNSMTTSKTTDRFYHIPRRYTDRSGWEDDAGEQPSILQVIEESESIENFLEENRSTLKKLQRLPQSASSTAVKDADEEEEEQIDDEDEEEH